MEIATNLANISFSSYLFSFSRLVFFCGFLLECKKQSNYIKNAPILLKDIVPKFTPKDMVLQSDSISVNI